MDGFDQIVPISQLPRRYLSILREAKTSGKPIIIFRRNKPVAGIVSYEHLSTLLEAKREAEEKEALEKISVGEREFKEGRAKILKSLRDLR